MKPLSEWNKKEKLQYLKDLTDSEERFFNDYSDEFNILLKDKDSEVRAKAVDALWEIPDNEFLNTLIELSEKDPDPIVRNRAIIGLGRYMYELDFESFNDDEIFLEYEDDDIPGEALIRTKEYLTGLYHNPEKSIDEKRHALEALAFLDDEKIEKFIMDAYESGEHLLKISAIFAMGRSGTPKWSDIILKELKSTNKEIQCEAIKAAGKLNIKEAAHDLIELSYSIDKDTMIEAIWALGQSGWSKAFERLDELSMSGDSDIKEMAEAALDEWHIASEGNADDKEDDEWDADDKEDDDWEDDEWDDGEWDDDIEDDDREDDEWEDDE